MEDGEDIVHWESIYYLLKFLRENSFLNYPTLTVGVTGEMLTSWRQDYHNQVILSFKKDGNIVFVSSKENNGNVNVVRGTVFYSEFPREIIQQIHDIKLDIQ